ncbi:major facilitator superfamily protein [Pseudohyphozyma bogoriensis]|nr:major facilitator superfamily protein [Pseudohyphozyma bogoriensis]
MNIPVQGTGLFLPTIVKTLGTYSSVEANLRTVPPYVVATAWSIAVAYGCFKTRKHGYWIAGSVSLSCIGYIIFITSRNNKVLYGATFLTYSGAVPCGPIFLAVGFPSSPSLPPHTCADTDLHSSGPRTNAAPETARAVTTAMVTGFASYGSVVATWAYLAKTAPRYVPGNTLRLESDADVGCCGK